jgi:teichuronic acid exporter
LNKENLIFSLAWSMVGQFGYLAIAFLVNIVLARLLGAFVFGQFSIVMAFVVIGKVLTESGMSGALIRNQKAVDLDYSTIFLFNLGLSLAIMLLIILSSSSLAQAYGDLGLRNLLIVSSLVLPISACQFVQNARLVKNLEFKKKAIYEFSSITIASIIAIVFALVGFGIWSLILLQIITALSLSIILWHFEGGVGKLKFDGDSFKSHYKFGMNTTATALTNSFFDNLYQLILGRYFSIVQAGFFFQAKKIQEVPSNVFVSLSHGAVFSSLTKYQNDHRQYEIMFSRIITGLLVIYGAVCMVIIFFSQNIIQIVYGESWKGTSGYLIFLVLASFFFIQEMFNQVIFKSYNQTHIIFRLELLKKSILSISIVLGVILKDIQVLLYGFLITNMASALVNLYVSRKRNDFQFSPDLRRLLLILTAGTASYLLHHSINLAFQIFGYWQFLSLPTLVGFYFVLLKQLRVFDVKKELTMIRDVFLKKTIL